LQSLLSFVDLNKIKKKIQAIIDDINFLINPKDDFNEKKEDEKTKEIQSVLEKIEVEINKKNGLLNQLQEQQNAKSLDFKSKFREIESKRAEKERLYRELQREEILNEKFELHLEDFKRRLEESGFQFEEIKKSYQTDKETELISIEEFSVLERKIWKGKQGLAEIGVQDQNVIAEYKEVSERYDFLTQQISDLNKGMEDLKVLIKELEEQIEDKFNEAIKEINHQFNNYFRLIFNGGSAKLIQKKEKTNNDNLIWGVDIQLNVPKTQLKGLEMLSGGEKTLVAVCLLFALVEQSEIPLLVVDEIDAALDEDNSRRFSEILKALSRKTQFIIITHNRMTMNAVQVIYGVTLSSDNSSQLLSLKLEEAEVLAEQG
jgi:chromosome segregation protein